MQVSSPARPARSAHFELQMVNIPLPHRNKMVQCAGLKRRRKNVRARIFYCAGQSGTFAGLAWTKAGNWSHDFRMRKRVG